MAIRYVAPPALTGPTPQELRMDEYRQKTAIRSAQQLAQAWIRQSALDDLKRQQGQDAARTDEGRARGDQAQAGFSREELSAGFDQRASAATQPGSDISWGNPVIDAARRETDQAAALNAGLLGLAPGATVAAAPSAEPIDAAFLGMTRGGPDPLRMGASRGIAAGPGAAMGIDLGPGQFSASDPAATAAAASRLREDFIPQMSAFLPSMPSTDPMDAERNRRVEEAERRSAVPSHLIESYAGAPTSLAGLNFGEYNEHEPRAFDDAAGAARLAAIEGLRTGTAGVPFGPGGRIPFDTAEINPVTGLPEPYQASPLPIRDLMAGLEGGTDMDREYTLPLDLGGRPAYATGTRVVAPDEVPAMEAEMVDQENWLRDYHRDNDAPVAEANPAKAEKILRSRQMAWKAGLMGEAGSIDEFIAAREAAEEGLGGSWYDELMNSNDPALKEVQDLISSIEQMELRREADAYWEDLQRRRMKAEGGDEFGLFEDYDPGALPAGEGALRGLITPQMLRRLAGERK